MKKKSKNWRFLIIQCEYPLGAQQYYTINLIQYAYFLDEITGKVFKIIVEKG